MFFFASFDKLYFNSMVLFTYIIFFNLVEFFINNDYVLITNLTLNISQKIHYNKLFNSIDSDSYNLSEIYNKSYNINLKFFVLIVIYFNFRNFFNPFMSNFIISNYIIIPMIITQLIIWNIFTSIKMISCCYLEEFYFYLIYNLIIM